MFDLVPEWERFVQTSSMWEVEDIPERIIDRLCRRFPQLALPIRHGQRDTPEYRSAVLRGEPVCREPDFIGSPEDMLETVETPAGKAEILYLALREDFEHALRALAYRCEPVEIPAAVGASTVRGLINWEKIRAHKAEYLACGKTDWNEEFKRFTAEKRNYLDTILLLSKGDYSAVPAGFTGLSQEEWTAKSGVIRKYHELTHFVCRTLYPHNVEAIRDEVIADAIGLTAAFGCYDARLAKRFLGIEDGVFHEGGRLSHYAGERNIETAASEASALIDRLAEYVGSIGKCAVFDLLMILIREYMNEV